MPLVNAPSIYQFKAKDFDIKNYTLCLGNISRDFSINNVKKTGLNGVAKIFLLIIMILILAKS